MTSQTQTRFDVLFISPEAEGRLIKVGTAFPTQKGTGYRCTLNASLSEGAQILLLPSRGRGEKPQSSDTAEQ